MDGSIDNNQNIYKNGTLEGTIAQKGDVEVRVPARHQADLYYVGRIGKLSIDFNASYMSIGTKERENQSEHSNEFPNREYTPWVTNTATSGQGNWFLVTHYGAEIYTGERNFPAQTHVGISTTKSRL